MIIIGLHFGHDSSISILKNGKIISCIELERITNIKHNIGIELKDIIKVLDNSKLKISDVDYCSITSTQDIDYVLNDHKKLDINFIQDYEFNRKNYLNVKKKPSRIKELIENRVDHVYLKRLRPRFLEKKNKYFRSNEDYVLPALWKKKYTLNNLHKYDMGNPLKNTNLDFSNKFHSFIEITINRVKIPGIILSHHMAHSAYSYYTSNFNNGLIFSHDGSLPRTGYWSGMMYYGHKNKIFPLFPHYLGIGKLYENTSALIGFDIESGPGKMMGLAPYGRPIFFDKKFVNNVNLFKKPSFIPKKLKKYFDKIQSSRFDFHFQNWIIHIYKQCKITKKNFDNCNIILSELNKDIAASTQLLIEEILLSTVKVSKKIINNNKMKTSNILLTGGTFLNCPSNTKIYQSKLFKNVHLPPAVHDGGLSMGSSLFMYYNILNNNLKKIKKMNYYDLAYLGKYRTKFDPKIYSDFLLNNKIKFNKKKDIYKNIALLLKENHIVPVFFKRSEIGPRALGHRSILANPSFENNWKLVNQIKKRELWRPFAPVVLEKFQNKFFKSIPNISPFMLYTAKVTSKLIPAVTHVDGTSRVQTSNKDSFEINKILLNFYNLTKLPILLNTSFNGPGQPIIEEPLDAIKFFIKNNKLKFLAIDDYLLEKN